ncbi:MAG: hypothetical protein J6V28_01605 [Tidjanibacter sp.]|nr:hypothetical protein [Tidjanibacter sp.]
MKRAIYISLLALFAVVAGECEAYGQTKKVNAQGKELTPVDIKSKRTRPVPVGDTTGYALTGDVVLYHNGAVITCDSVVRYSEREMTCFGNVIIKKDDTYIYGDRAEYSRDAGEARVYSPLVKVMNKESTLYTYNLVFNTAENIGRFYGGGTFSNGVNLMESERGYFYADLDELVGVENVQMKNETYEMKSDSVNYNSETEVARYFSRSITWKNDGEILASDDGEYHNKEQRYIFRRNAYVMGENQEMWADTVDYRELVQFIELKHNAQIRDEEHKSVIFGHYGNYDDKLGDTFLTQNPAYISYGDADGDGRNDTVYMRSDSMYVYLIDSLGYTTLTRPDSATLAAELAAKAQAIIDKRIADSMAVVKAEREKFVADSVATAEKEWKAHLLDSLHTLRASFEAMGELGDSLALVSQRVTRSIDSLENPVVDTSALVEEDGDGGLNVEGGEENVNKDSSDADLAAEGALGDESDGEDRTDGEAGSERDNLAPAAGGVNARSLAEGFVPEESVGATPEEAETPADSLPKKNARDRIMLGLRNVKVFRTDFQGICDSMLMFSADSTAQLHKNSVMWNELNQIASERADVYTHKQKPYKVLFSEGKPLMSSEIDTTRYNQVAGKTIEAKFNDGVMYRTDVVGNAQTYYYMVDDADGALMGYLVAEAADMTFYIENNTVEGIMYRGDPVYTIYPMDKIPADQPQRMPEFVWYIDKKPTAEIIMGDWIVNPSERERYQRMKRPQFPITYTIERHKESLISGGGWADRDDDISDEAKDFIERVRDK